MLGNAAIPSALRTAVDPSFVMTHRHWRNGNRVALLESKYPDEVPLLRF